MSRFLYSRERRGGFFLSAALFFSLLLCTLPGRAQSIYTLNVSGSTADIASDSTGTVHILWYSGGCLYYGKIVSNQVTGQETVVQDSVSTYFTRPRLAVQPDGSSIHAVYRSTGSTTSTLYHVWKGATGGWQREVASASVASHIHEAPMAAVDTAGTVHVLYQWWNTSNDKTPIRYIRKAVGAAWTSPVDLTPNPTREYRDVSLFADRNGGVHASWRTHWSPSLYRYAPSGKTLDQVSTEEIPKASDVQANAFGDLFVDSTGRVHRPIATWTTRSTVTIDYSSKPVGGTFSSPTRPSMGDLKTDYDVWPAVAADASGKVYVAFSDYSSSSSVYLSTLSDGVWSKVTLDSSAGMSQAIKPSLAMTSSALYILWRGSTGQLKLGVLPVTSPAALQLTSPNGGETWKIGQSKTITWTSSGLSGTIDLELYQNGSKVGTIVQGLASSVKSYSWTAGSLTTGQAASGVYSVKVVASGDSLSDTSDASFYLYDDTTPIVGVSKGSLAFGAVTGAVTSAQPLIVFNAGGGTLNWTATADQSWITLSPSSGTGTSLFNVGVVPGTLAPGTYRGNVTVTASGGLGSGSTVAVTLTVYAATATKVPYGFFDTPTDNSTVTGSIPVAGWALDDVEVTSVKIYRSPSSTESGNVFLGNATIIEGARPDVESTYPNAPFAGRAGWGFMLLTYGLPNQGMNDSFTIYAYAFDKEGNNVLIGSRRINSRNNTNTSPFGAIDTPTQGGTASGAGFVNFGWALTPQPKSIATDGSTLLVYVDGVNLGHPHYGYARADIQEAFPGYANTNTAVGYYELDTTKYANGVHTISWTVWDSANVMTGIGSRYFTIFNGSGGAPLKAPFSGLSAQSWKALASAGSSLTVRKGWKGDLSLLPGGEAKRVSLEEVEPLEILLDGSVQWEAGATVVSGELRNLPIGSSLVGNRFSWHPGPGQLGTFFLTFRGETSQGLPIKEEVVVRILPRGSGSKSPLSVDPETVR